MSAVCVGGGGVELRLIEMIIIGLIPHSTTKKWTLF